MKKFDDFMYKVHGKWINETDFSEYSFKDIKAQASGVEAREKALVREIDLMGESTTYYDRFIDLYLKLYYEPLVEEYDELKYFTPHHDQAMH